MHMLQVRLGEAEDTGGPGPEAGAHQAPPGGSQAARDHAALSASTKSHAVSIPSSQTRIRSSRAWAR